MSGVTEPTAITLYHRTAAGPAILEHGFHDTRGSYGFATSGPAACACPTSRWER
jgi:hypothetical protein